MLRPVLGFLAAPIPAATVQAGVVAIWPKQEPGVFSHPDSMFVAICVLFYAVLLITGVPLLVLAHRRRITSLRVYALGGLFAMGIPVAAALAWATGRGQLAAWPIAYNLGLFGLGGALAGAVYWLVVVRRQRTI